MTDWVGNGPGVIFMSCLFGGVVLIASDNWRTSGTVAGVIWFVVLGATTVGVFLFAASEWAGSRSRERQERIKQEVIEVLPEYQDGIVRPGSRFDQGVDLGSQVDHQGISNVRGAAFALVELVRRI